MMTQYYHMYNFHYNIMKEHFGDRVKLLYTDTDSLIYEIQSENVYKEFASQKLQDYFDFSKYSDSHVSFEGMTKEAIKELKERNCAIPGKFKDEMDGKTIEEVVALKPKMYSVVVEDPSKSIKKAKGVPKQTTKKIGHSEYKKSTEQAYQRTEEFYSIQSRKHQLMTLKLTKNSISSFDDKRYYLNLIDSRAIGHKDNK